MRVFAAVERSDRGRGRAAAKCTLGVLEESHIWGSVRSSNDRGLTSSTIHDIAKIKNTPQQKNYCRQKKMSTLHCSLWNHGIC